MRNLILLQLVLILLSCGRNDQLQAERRLLKAALEAEKLEEEAEKQKEKERAREERLAKIPPFVDLGDTLNFTDENGWKQGIWEYRVEGMDEFKITPAGETEAIKLDGKVQEIRQYYNDTLHGIYKWYDMFNGFRLCIKGTYIMGRKDGHWEYPCNAKDSIFDSVFDVD